MSSDADKPEVKVFKFGVESLSDVIFIVGDEEFHCHKMGLACRSPYFTAMFNSSFKEKNEERIEIDADPVAFRRLMEILYDGIFEDYATLFSHFCDDMYRTRALWSESCALLELADRFLVSDIVQKAFETYMMRSRCENAYCYSCATRLLLSLRFHMKDYKDVCKANRATIINVSRLLIKIQKEVTFSTEDFLFLMNHA